MLPCGARQTATDAMSQTKLDQHFPGATVRRTPRAREVRQSWITRFADQTCCRAVHPALCSALAALRGQNMT